MGFLTDIVIRVAKSLGLELQKKPVYVDDYSNVNDISLTAVVANRVATLAMLDSNIDVVGTSERARYLDDFMQDYVADRMAVAAEVSLGTGDCLVKPYTDGKRIGIDIIKNNNFAVCESVGNYIKSCIIKCDEIRDENGNSYERIETQAVKDVTTDGGKIPVLFIWQNAYKNGTEIPLTSVKAWANIKTEDYIPNVDRPLFGRYKCPTVNRRDINGANGVKITYGLDAAMNEAVKAYHRFNEEYAKKETMIFADKTLFTKDKNGKVVLPDGKSKLFMQVRGDGDSELIKEYSPDLRADQLEKGIDVNFKMLELMAGLSSGILTSPTTNYATATEIKATLNATYAFMTKFRKTLQKGTNDLLYSVDVICNRNNITSVGTWEAKYDWSSSYIENIQEQFNRLMQAESISAVENAEIRAWVMDEEYEVAKKRVEEIREEYGEKVDITPPSNPGEL